MPPAPSLFDLENEISRVRVKAAVIVAFMPWRSAAKGGADAPRALCYTPRRHCGVDSIFQGKGDRDSMTRTATLVVTFLLSGSVLAWGCGNDAAQEGAQGGDDAQSDGAMQVAQSSPEKSQAKATPPLLNPKSEAMNKTAPDLFKVKFETTAGDFVMEVHRDWSPRGVDRFYNLVNGGYFDGCKFFRVVKGFVAQFGLNGDPKVTAAWQQANIEDEPVKQSNTRGSVCYAKAGPNTRTTQLFINYKDNSRLDGMGFAVFAQVVEGMDVVDKLYSGYGDAPTGPDQAKIMAEGDAYLDKSFPKLDTIKSASVMK
jgi:peptidyl-prolyl cis-trans isomerase A (cyclophilin A)